MKRILALIVLVASVITLAAIPAKRIWKRVSQPDGSTIEVTLAGDENMHCYITRDGVALALDADGRYCYAELKGGQLQSSSLLAHEVDRRSAAEKATAVSFGELNTTVAKSVRAVSTGRSHPKVRRTAAQRQKLFSGSRKAPVILASFSDKSFSQDDASIVEFYNAVLNEEGFSQYGAPGSVHDYFRDMSRRQFDLTFDVIGPVKVSKSATYYGGPSVLFGGSDHIGEFITEAIKNADAKYDIDWTKYDWDGDGEVEQVFVLYAGYGQATGGPTGTIWPNAWTLDEAMANNDGEGGFSLGGVLINQYACSNELYLNSGTTKMGHGVFCHEFSHCMGLPDMYDTNYGSTPTMGDWDLLASGSYNGPAGIGWCPAGWTSYERAYAGWLDITELQPGDKITGMKELLDPEAKAYAVYNDNHPDEYYLLENHTNRSWDAYTPEDGLLVIHVDYDKQLFDNNIVNTKGEFTPEGGYDGYYTNDHPRMAPFSKVRSIDNGTYFYTYPMNAPRGVIDSLTDNSKPSAMLYNALADGAKLMGKPIYNIKKDSETGDISFTFMTKEENAELAISVVEADDIEPASAVYNLSGQSVGNIRDARYGTMKPGLYIIKKEGKYKKYIVK